MPFIATEQAVGQLREVLEEKFELRRKELANGPELPPPVKKWVTAEWGFPESADMGDYPKGVVNFDPERRFERREQDSGDTSEVDVKISVYFTLRSMSEDEANTMAVRYGDAVAWTLMREARVTRPRDGTALPGLFRVLPKAMRTGKAKDVDLYGCEVDAVIIMDQQFDWLT